MDTEEEITIDLWSIEKRGNWWFQTATFELKSPEADISSYKKWDNGHLSWKITKKKRTVEGKVVGKFLRGLYGVITIYATKRSIHAKEIADLKEKLLPLHKMSNYLSQQLKELEDNNHNLAKKIHELNEFIREKNREKDRLSLNYMTIAEAKERLQELKQEEPLQSKL